MSEAFTPVPPKPKKVPKDATIKVPVTEAQYRLLRERAHECGMSMREFTRQGLAFALQHMGKQS